MRFGLIWTDVTMGFQWHSPAAAEAAAAGGVAAVAAAAAAAAGGAATVAAAAAAAFESGVGLVWRYDVRCNLLRGRKAPVHHPHWHGS